MKRFLLLLITMLGTLNCFSQSAVVEGKVPGNFAGKQIQLILMNYETRDDKVVQEVTADRNGVFKFKIQTKEPLIYTISIADLTDAQVLVKPGDKIHLDLNKDKVVSTGSVETKYLVDYEANRKRVFDKYLKPAYDSSAVAVRSGDQARIEYWTLQHEKATEKYKAELATWVKQPFFINSLAAVHHSIRWHADYDIALMDKMVAIYQAKYPKSELTRELVSKVKATKRIAIGAIAPEFSSKDTSGHAISLKSFRGKYTMVDFWASWCAPCRQESPALVRQYAKYKNKGFTILSVSIDKVRSRWTSAIKADGFSWTNVSDLAGYSGATPSMYAVTSIPASFLLDKEGRIIAKNLRGKLLEEKLKELLGE